MLFNENDVAVLQTDNDVDVDAVDMDLNTEDVDLDFDAINDGSQTDTTDEYHEDVDLDFDAIEDGSQTDVTDEYHESGDIDIKDEANITVGDSGDETAAPTTCGDDAKFEDVVDIEGSDFDLDVDDDEEDDDDICPNCGKKSDECECECEGCKKCESVAPITFSERSVRVFQRRNTNLIMEADLLAVAHYYNDELSLQECVELIANAHNISEDSITILMSEVADTSKSLKAKTVKANTGVIDAQLKKLREIKKKMTPEKWAKSPQKRQYDKLLGQKKIKMASV